MRRACILLAGMITACASSAEKTYEGLYVFSSEAEIFSPCGSGGRAWWVIASEPIWLELRDTTLRLTSEPYEGIYVQVRGFYAGPATEETGGAFSTQYEGLFRVTKLVSARESRESDCKVPANLEE